MLPNTLPGGAAFAGSNQCQMQNSSKTEAISWPIIVSSTDWERERNWREIIRRSRCSWHWRPSPADGRRWWSWWWWRWRLQARWASYGSRQRRGLGACWGARAGPTPRRWDRRVFRSCTPLRLQNRIEHHSAIISYMDATDVRQQRTPINYCYSISLATSWRGLTNEWMNK